MRVTTAFNRMLAIPGATVASVSFAPDGIVVGLRRRARKLRCPCGRQVRAAYDRTTRRWRHLDLGSCKLVLESEIRRLDCPSCGKVRTEVVPWARPGARHTRDFEDVVAWLARHTDKTTITKLLRCSWEAVAGIVARVVAQAIDDARLDDLYRIGVDEIAYRTGPRYLTVVADHDRKGAVVWVGEGRSSATLDAFFAELGKERAKRLVAVSMDMGGAYAKAAAEHASQARRCVDPFHVVKLANEALDKARRWAWNEFRRAGEARATWVKRTRWSLVKDPADLTVAQRNMLDDLRAEGSVLWRAWLMKESLRDTYTIRDPKIASGHLDLWLGWASRCRIPSFVKLAKTVRANREGILDAIELGLSNSKLEGLNSKIRLINHRGYGHHSAAALIAMIYLCAGGITVELPTGS